MGNDPEFSRFIIELRRPGSQASPATTAWTRQPTHTSHAHAKQRHPSPATPAQLPQPSHPSPATPLKPGHTNRAIPAQPKNVASG